LCIDIRRVFHGYKTIHVRSNALKVFGGQGSVDVSIHLPQAESLPLFTRIPCRIHIICNSKPMSSSHSTDPTSFTFPRNPKMSDIELELKQHSRTKISGYKGRCKDSCGTIGGFGSMENPSDIDTQMTAPVWMPDEKTSGKGRWMESVTYTTHLILNCPTPIQTQLICTEIHIDATIDFPGIGNTWKETIGPLPISSGITNPERNGLDQDLDFAVPPSYWDVVGDEDVDSKDEKFNEKE